MPSSYTTSLRLTLPATGELAGQWGNTVNTGITELLDAAVAGTTTISTWGGAGVAYTLSNNSGTADEARRMFIVATGTPGEAKNVICPAVSKFYVFRNDTTGGFALTLKTSGGTGIAVPAGQYKFLYCDGTNVVEMFNSAGALTLSGALTVGGTATFAANPTLSAGTANQVQFLNASKVLVGSANLTFNGTDLTVSGAVNAGTVNATTLDLTNLEVTNIKAKDGTASASIADSTGVMSLVANPVFSGGTANGVLYLNGSKVATSGSALTFDGSNLGIGTSSPAYKLDVAGSARFTNGEFLYFNNSSGTAKTVLGYFSDNNTYLDAADGAIIMRTGSGTVERMRLDSSGNLGIGTSSPTQKLDVNGRGIFTVADNTYATAFNATTGNLRITPYESSTYSSTALVAYSAGYAGYGPLTVDALNHRWWVSGSEQMRLTSTGLGIGTSSPNQKLDVAGSVQIRSSGTHYLNNSDNTNQYYWQNIGATGANNATLILSRTNAGETLRVDSSGNLGLGVTPSAWGVNTRALQMGDYAALNSDTQNGATNVSMNAFFNGTNWIYRNSSWPASYYNQTNGQHRWWTAPSGTAGNTISFTETMTLDASGQLSVGTTDTTAVRFKVQSGSDPIVFLSGFGGAGTMGVIGANPLAIYTNGFERARITSDGYFGIGVNPSYILHVAGGASAATRRIQFDNNSATGSAANLLVLNRTSNTSMPAQIVGQIQFNRTLTDSTIETAGSIGVSGDNTAGSSVGNMTLAATTQFIYQIGTEKARLTSAANFKIGGTNTRATTEGTNQLVLFNGTAPAGTLTNGVSIYSSSGEAYVMDAAGNATLFSPHDKETNEWIFKSKHTPTGKVLRIDVEKLLRFVNDHFGLDAVQEFIEQP